MTNTENCPCGSGSTYADCCAPYHKGSKTAPSAETLMRSRYSAFALAEVDYILSTEKLAQPNSKADLQQWCKTTSWVHLDVIDSGTDWVHFEVHYIHNNTLEGFRECSSFEQHEGQWYYSSGQSEALEGMGQKIGRNDACPCGSGKKYKKCHGGS